MARPYSHVTILGHIWQPGVGLCSTVRTLDADWMEAQGYDVRDRDDVERWIILHDCGDFQSVTDFRAVLHVGGETIEHEWAREESEWEYCDTLPDDC